MGYLTANQTGNYYKGNDGIQSSDSEFLGNYQFTSLNDIITNFMVVYVGENKIIPKAKRLDVAFHAQRAMQELSFDTFKSINTLYILLPKPQMLSRINKIQTVVLFLKMILLAMVQMVILNMVSTRCLA